MPKTDSQTPLDTTVTAAPAPTARQPHFDVHAPEIAHYTRTTTDRGEPLTCARYHDGSIRLATDAFDLHLHDNAGPVSRVLQQPHTPDR